MISTNKVFITGMSALTPSGQDLNTTWSNLINQKSFIKKISTWDLDGFDVCLGGEIADVSAKMLPDKKLKKVISKQDIFGINAAQQAMQHSGLIDYQQAMTNNTPDLAEEFADKSGVYVGSPGNKYYQQYDFLPLIAKTNGDMQKFAEGLFSEVHPMWLLRSLPNNVLAYIGITYGLKGANHNITNHAVSGSQALIEAYHAIQSGQIDRACVVAYDLGIEPQALYYYDKLGLLSTNDLKPFNSCHDGTVLAEGASAIILENEHSVRNRNATCYAELVGGHASTENSGLFSIQEDGDSLQQLINQTLEKFSVENSDISILTAHGNGNPKSDISEAIAINQTFNTNTPVTAFKWSMGHTLCASGILDTVLTTVALNNKCIPGIANLDKISNKCPNLNISQQTRKMDKAPSHALIINRGFASMNACVLIKACD